MDKNNIFSLIIPCFNEEETILEVIKESKDLVDEMIVVNDCSSDNTKRLLGRKKDIVLLNNKKRLGQEKSIEKGIKKSSGNVLITMDADMEHDPNDIKRMKKYFLENDFDLVIGKRRKIPRIGEKKLNKIFEKKYGITDVMNGFRMFKKGLYNEIGFFYKNDYFGLDFLIESLRKFKVGQITLSENRCRRNARIGSDEEINRKLEEIIIYVRKELKNGKT